MLEYRFRMSRLAVFVTALLVSSPTFGESAALVESEPQQETSWVNLLGDNYKQLWRGYKEKSWPQGWKVEDGVLSRFDGGGDIITTKKYASFELQLEWKISKDGNSGIMYRVRTGDDAPYFSGPEYQILDNKGHQDGANLSTSSGALYALYAPEKDWTKPVGKWNTTRIVVRDQHVQHWLNGHKTVDCTIGSDDWNERYEKSKFKEWEQFAKSAEGHIALQDHGNLVWYRNVRIRSLPNKKP